MTSHAPSTMNLHTGASAEKWMMEEVRFEGMIFCGYLDIA
jgi:hypothetical protein